MLIYFLQTSILSGMLHLPNMIKIAHYVCKISGFSPREVMDSSKEEFIISIEEYEKQMKQKSARKC